MHIPEDFTERLERQFRGRYRIRWSDTRNEYLIEQKVRRGVAEGFVDVGLNSTAQLRRHADDYIRARDGYVLTMAVKPGTRTWCHECNTQMDVPAFDTAVLVCPFCRSKGRYRAQVAGYFPLGDTLIDHLKMIDVDNDGNDRVAEAVDLHNEFLMFENTMRLRRHVDAGARERYNRLVGIAQVGQTGRSGRFVHRKDIFVPSYQR